MSTTVPPLVFTLWWAALIVTLVVFVPLAVYVLHSTWRAAHSIARYARETLVAAGGVAGNTQHITALDATIDTASHMIALAGNVEQKLGTIADVLGQRAHEKGYLP